MIIYCFITTLIVKFLTFGDAGSSFANDAFKTECIKNKCMFQCTNDVNAVLNTTFTKHESLASISLAKTQKNNNCMR